MASSEKPPVELFAGEPAAPLQRLWLLMLTHNLWLLAAAIGVVIFAAGAAIDLALLKHEAVLVIVTSNGLAGLLAAALVFTLLAYGRAQRRRIEKRMQALLEVNHHIRNALQALAFAAGSLRDRQESAAISEAVERIHWALAEVLPRVEPAYEPFEGTGRNIGGRKWTPQGPDPR